MPRLWFSSLLLVPFLCTQQTPPFAPHCEGASTSTIAGSPFSPDYFFVIHQRKDVIFVLNNLACYAKSSQYNLASHCGFSVGFWVPQKSGSRHGVRFKCSSIHETWAGHWFSGTGTPPHCLTRTEVHPRSLIDWRPRKRRLTQLQ